MKKGFTLIELLAVIVILAIIAVIAVPIVLNIIDESKENASLRSAEMYLNAVEYTISDAYLNHGGLQDGEYPITKEGNLCKTALPCSEENTLKVEVNGEKPSSGTITITNGKISGLSILLEGKTIVKNSEGELAFANEKNGCTYVDEDNSGTINLSDTVTCGTESFHVISNDGSNVTMLAAKNLNLDVTNPIQSDSAGTTAFSTTNYWTDMESCDYLVYPAYGDYPDEEGNQQSLIYPYVNAYETYLKKNGVSSAIATLMNLNQTSILGCYFDGVEYYTCGPAIDGSYALEDPAPSWVYSTTYWLGESYGSCSDEVWVIHSSGEFGPNNSFYGVRPVVTISISEIEK